MRPNQSTDPAADDSDSPSASTRAMRWAQLLKPVFAIDLTTCPQCGSPLTILKAIEGPTVIVKILAHLGVCPRVRHLGHWPVETNPSW